MIDVGEQARCIRHLESRIDADKEARRRDQGFKRTELNAFDHPRNFADLAGGVNADLDPHFFVAADALLNFLCDRTLRIVDRTLPDLHFALRRGGAGIARDGQCGQRAKIST